MFLSFEKPYILFIHVSKTGGTSLYEWLKNYKVVDYLNDHVSYRDAEIILNRYINLNEYYKFSIVRNPYDRAYSAFVHDKKRGYSGTFEDCLKFRKNRTATFLTEGIDEIFKYERYNEMVEKIKNKFGFEGEPIIFDNNTVNTDYDVYPLQDFKYVKIYEKNKHLVPLINKIYADDFRNFDYKMLCW